MAVLGSIQRASSPRTLLTSVRQNLLYLNILGITLKCNTWTKTKKKSLHLRFVGMLSPIRDKVIITENGEKENPTCDSLSRHLGLMWERKYFRKRLSSTQKSYFSSYMRNKNVCTMSVFCRAISYNILVPTFYKMEKYHVQTSMFSGFDLISNR
jgi:hypothetical protein